MNILFNELFLKHNADSPAEGAYRLIKFPLKYENQYAEGAHLIRLVHSEKYIEKIHTACVRRDLLAEVVLSPESYEAALLAVGLTVKASQQGDFAAVRPPGHHAGRDGAAGFCFFNNIAIAAQQLVNEGKKVFIFDFDAHHGNGTQDIFYHSDRVFYCSAHQMYTYPFTGFATETGADKGEGCTLNIPLVPGSGDEKFLEAVDGAIAVAAQFKPDVVGISAGFDGYLKDKMLGLDISQKAYYECGFRWRRAHSEIFATLEGGYHDEVMECAEAFVEGVNVGGRPRKVLYDTDMSVG